MRKVALAALVETSGSPLVRQLAGGSATAIAFKLSTGVRSPLVLAFAFLLGASTVKESIDGKA